MGAVRVDWREEVGGRWTARTVGLAAQSRPELLLVSLPTMAIGLREYLGRLLSHLAEEVARRNLGDGGHVSFGEYGQVRLAAAQDADGQAVLAIRDLPIGSENADHFVARLMGLTGFEQMNKGAPEAAIECLGVALALEPRNSMLLHARAWARYALLTSDTHQVDPGVLSLQVFGDLLRAIEFGPDQPQVYTDLLTLLKAFRPRDESNWDEHRQWVSELVRIALSFRTQNPEAVTRRAELWDFAREGTSVR